MSEVLKQKIRRDLSRWSTKLLICMGLETVGRQLVGEENWRHLYPVEGDWEHDKKRVSDFDPTTSTEEIQLTPPHHPPENTRATSTPHDLSHHLHPCPSVSAEEEDDVQSDSEEKNDNYENIFRLLPYWYFFNRAFGVPSSNEGTRNTSDLTISNTNHPLIEALDAQHLNTLLLLHSLKQQQELQLQLEAGSGQMAGSDVPFSRTQKIPSHQFQDPHELANNLSQTQGYDASTEYTHFLRHATFSNSGLSRCPSDDLEQPLDLTQKNKVAADAQFEENNSSHQLVATKVTSSNRKGSNSLERYSRPTLKSSPRSGRGYTSQELEAALSDIQSGKLGTRRAAVIYGIPRSTLRNKVYKLGKDQTRTHRRVHKVPEESSRNLQLSTQRLTGGMASIGSAKESAFSPVLKCSRQTSSAATCEVSEEEKSKEEISREKKALKEWLHSKLLRQRLNNLESSKNDEIIRNESTEHNSSKVRNVSESSDCSDEANNFLNVDPNVSDGRMGMKRRLCYEESSIQPQQIAQIPTPFSTPASTVTSPMDTAVPDWSTLHVNDDDCSMEDSDLSTTNGTTKRKDRKEYFEGGQNQTSVTSGFNSDADANGKKSRPKRGKYRNYDRDALLKAVKAVQNGEMSVHRAGSYFGVPHSTLEYKVKERHLLRRPKRKDSGTLKINQKSSSESSFSGSEPGSQNPRMEFSPVTSARESLSKFLSIGSLRSGVTSPDSVSNTIGQRSDKGLRESYNHFHENYVNCEIENACSKGQCPESFQVNDLIRNNFDNSSLLDLTKKS